MDRQKNSLFSGKGLPAPESLFALKFRSARLAMLQKSARMFSLSELFENVQQSERGVPDLHSLFSSLHPCGISNILECQ